MSRYRVEKLGNFFFLAAVARFRSFSSSPEEDKTRETAQRKGVKGEDGRRMERGT